MSVSVNSDRELQQLAEAFNTFNVVSSQLEASYSSLEHRMTELRAQLASAREQRRAVTADNAILEQRITGILDALPGGVVVIDKRGRVTNANRRARSWLPGLEPGVDWQQLSSAVFETEVSEHGDLVLRNGQRFIVTKEPASGGEDIILFTDVTEQRQVDEVLARHRKLAGFGEMLATLAHQMRTPITAALLYASSAREQTRDAARRELLLGKAIGCLSDLETLISDMLTFARGNTARGEEFIDVAELLNEVEQSVEPLRAASQTLTFATPDSGVRVRGNPRVLASAIENLVVNALQCAGRSACVRVSAAVHDEMRDRDYGENAVNPKTSFAENSVNVGSKRRVCIEVRDNGPGVPAGDERRIFEPFFSGRADGTGLGLAAARSIIRAHRGNLELVSSPETGACFTISLPLLEPSREPANAAQGASQ
jgi:two-component system sensor histidine kinase FlrB